MEHLRLYRAVNEFAHMSIAHSGGKGDKRNEDLRKMPAKPRELQSLKNWLLVTDASNHKRQHTQS